MKYPVVPSHVFAASTFVKVLCQRAARQPTQTAYIFLQDGETQEASLAYGDLDRQARSIGATLHDLGALGKRILLLYPPGLDYIAAFFASLYAGAIVVPAYPPDPARLNRTLPRLQAIVADAQATIALTTTPVLSMAELLFDQAPDLAALHWLATDQLADRAEEWCDPAASGDDLAFLQYTSGSTTTPRGVMLTHKNLLHNSALIHDNFGHTPASRGVIWLPPYHDMGLIGGILQPLYGGFPVTLISPIDFLKRPLRWLQAISRYRATTSGGPNFAYDLCVRKITPEERAELDLSSWEVAFNGAEPVRHETIDRFAEAFAPCGFRKEAFYPCYGLAEATLIVSGGLKLAPPVALTVSSAALGQNRAEVASSADADAQTLVGCGRALADQRIVVVNPETLELCLPNQVGEIWVSGTSVAHGYWNQPDKTTGTFRACLAGSAQDAFLRTGDLGFLRDNELYVTGRLKDLVIIRGQNYYPHDIELTVEKSHPALRPGCGAAFSVPVAGEERLVIVQEIGRQTEDINKVVHAIRQAVVEHHELQVYTVVLIEAGSIPKTSSGKIQRHACRAGFLSNSMEIVTRNTLDTESGETLPVVHVEETFIRKALAAMNDPVARQALLTIFLQEQVARVVRVAPFRVDVQQPLSALGLDSLMAIELQYQIEANLGLVLPMADLLQGPHIAQLADHILARLEALSSASPMAVSLKHRAEAKPVLSHGQRALWFLHQLAPANAAYNIAKAVQIRGDLDVPALKRAFQAVVNRHSSLRATFLDLPEGPTPRIHEQSEIFFQVEDIATWSEAALNERLVQKAYRPFDLERGPLLRIFLFTRTAQEHILLLVVHHIVSDFWSLAVIARELETLYTAERNNVAASFAPLALQYTDYVHWQTDQLAHAEGAQLWKYWRQQLAGELPVLNLPADHPRPLAQTFCGASQAFQLDTSFTQKLKALSRANNATLYTTLLAAFQTLLYRYTGQRDILVGSPASGRSVADLMGLVGYLVNPVVLRANLDGDLSFVEFLSQVRRTVLDALAHQSYPFGVLVERLQPRRDPSHSPIFQVMFTLQQSPLRDREELAALALGETGTQMDWGGLVLEPVVLEQRVAQFDLTLVLAETAEGLRGYLQYNRDLFEAATICRMLEHLRTLLENIATQPEQRLSRLPLLTEAERCQLLASWNNTRTDYARDACVHELFEFQAARTPNAIAVMFEDERLTYHELNAWANQVAHHLRALGVEPGTLVGICMERSLEMLVGVLGILKAGAAYVPLDPTHPKERLAFMLRDAHISVLLTQKRWTAILSEYQAQLVCLDADRESVAQQSQVNLPGLPSSECLAYIIYTSGSTGKPKGVQIPHRAVVNFLYSMRRQPGLIEQDALLSVTTLSFDIAGLELFLPLTTGARVVLVSREVASDGQRLATQLARAQATVMQATPATWRLLLETGWMGAPNLKILCGGEALPRELADLLVEKGVSVWNMYGPTETTIWSAICQVQAKKGPVPIGHPIANTQFYLLDGQFNPVPLGVPGELYIGGDGLAWGYLNRPDLTADKFIPNPFSSLGDGKSRLYRTGDLARYLPDGRLEFLGRADFQVKMRGYRIELAEIEALLDQHPAIRQGIVVAHERGAADEKRLVAYCVPAQTPAPTDDELRRFLKEKLPDYMVPAAFVMLDALPLTPNGKVNRCALPIPEQPAETRPAYMPPQSEAERMIARVWCDVLQMDKVGIRDNFFDLGGHSLLMARVHRRLRESLGRDLTMVELFQYPTISSLVKYLRQGKDEHAVAQPTHDRARLRREMIQQLETGIAVIGMTGRFPGSRTLGEFWQNLCNGVESISFFSQAELLASGVPSALLDDPNYVRAGAVLDDVELFDASFFGYNPREAEIMDPQHRLFLECAWEALESAGYDSARYSGQIGVYASAGINSYLLNNLQSNRDLMQSVGGYQTFIANDKDFVPTRVSYKLNLRGPSVNVQTACSSSLVAIHLACQGLLTGECDMALAGGISINLPQKAGYVYQERGIASPDGHCRAFDANARGTVRGSGVGIVVLKRLSEAIADRDLIYAVVKGSAINNDGSVKVGYTAPSVEGQARVIAEAQAVAGVAPETLSYVEAHGTGTEIGDPIEVAALAQAFARSSHGDAHRQAFCALGSVKTNIGHLDTAAGVAGFIKTALALYHRKIPPSLNFEQPNPKFDLEASPFYVNTVLSEWEAGRTSRRAGVSSFGVGGTNAHVVLEEAPEVEPTGPSWPWQVLVLSAKTSTALETTTLNLASHFQQQPALNLADVAYTLQTGRHVLNHRRVVICQSTSDAVSALETLDPKRVFTGAYELNERPVAFMFTGQGAQYVNMARGLYETERTFREQVDRCAELLRLHLGLDLRDVLYPDDERAQIASQQLDQTWLTQPSLFVIEYALSKLWIEWGIRPQAMIGHSIGEYVAACLAGVFTLEDALAIVAARGRMMQHLPGGVMLAVPLPEQEVQALLGKTVSLAALNGPAMCVVSGTTGAVEKLERQLARQGVDCRRLRTSHAFHSAMMDPILTPFEERVRQAALSPPQIPCVSNATGKWLTAEEATDPGYWARHLRQPVRFAEGVQLLLQVPDQVLIEVGPGRTLSTLVARHPARSTDRVVLSSLRHAQDQQSDVAFVLTTLGKLWMVGVPVDWQGLYIHEQRRRVLLPTYPFERQHYWVEPQAVRPPPIEPAATRRSDMADWFYIPSWKRSALVSKMDGEPIQSDWLIFADAEVGAELAKRLERTGQDVTMVRTGMTFAKLTDREYVLNPGQADGYDALLKDLHEQDKKPRTIVHLWNVTGNHPVELELEKADAAQQVGFYSLLFLAQALGKRDTSEVVSINVVSNNMQEVTGEEALCPEKATVLGPVQIIPHEYPHITCRSIDVAEVQASARLIDWLLAEIAAESPDLIVAYRGNHRWVRTFEPIRLGELEPKFRKEGVYLITGGLGGMGLVLAKHLAQAVQARLILIGRSALPPTEEWEQWCSTHGEHDRTSYKIRHVQELLQLGSQVLVVSADVANLDQMRAAIDQGLAQFGHINGVIHAAGVPASGIMQLKTRQMAEQVLAPKLRGTLILDALLKNMPLDVFVLCSSVNSVLGRIGQVDYCAANAFLDAFAHCKHLAGAPIVCINWDTWREVGMAANAIEQLTRMPVTGATSKPVGHPLLGERIVESETLDVYSTILSTHKHWELYEHRVLGKPTLPGTAYLEMARAAFDNRTGQNVMEIRDAYFPAPLMLREDEEKEIHIILKKQEHTFAFSVMSKTDRGENDWQEHAGGILAPLKAEPLVRRDIQTIESMCNEQHILAPLEKTRLGYFGLQRWSNSPSSLRGKPTSIDSIVITDQSETQPRSMEFGPRWNTLKWVKLGINEGLGFFELDDEFAADLQFYCLHPALLDLGAGFLRLFKSQGSYLPLSYKKISIKAPLSRKMFGYARFAGDNLSQSVTLHFDIVFMDEQGTELVRVEEFTMIRLDDASKLNTFSPTLSSHSTLGGSSLRKDLAIHTSVFQQHLEEGLLPTEGIEALSRILGSYLPCVVVSTHNFMTRIEQSRTTSLSLASQILEEAAPSAPQHPRPQLMTAYAAPRNLVEQKLAEIWQRTLGIDQVGVHDSFFDLGGDSLLITRIHGMLKEYFETDLSVASLLQHPTIAELAPFLSKQDSIPVGFEQVQERVSKQKEAVQRRAQAMRKHRRKKDE